MDALSPGTVRFLLSGIGNPSFVLNMGSNLGTRLVHRNLLPTAYLGN